MSQVSTPTAVQTVPLVTFSCENDNSKRLKLSCYMQNIFPDRASGIKERFSNYDIKLFVFSFVDVHGKTQLCPGEVLANIPHNAREITFALYSFGDATGVLGETALRIVELLKKEE